MLSSQGKRSALRERIENTPYEQIFVSVISVEEAIEGARNLIYRQGRVVAGYELLTRVFTSYSKFQILSYDEDALEVFNRFPKDAKRVTKSDRQIAATAMAKGYLVVTRNLRDFQQIGVPCEDWSR